MILKLCALRETIYLKNDVKFEWLHMQQYVSQMTTKLIGIHRKVC